MATGRADIDVSDVMTSEDLHDLLRDRLAFPGWYGRNWDAFWDCARDPEISVMPAVLCIRGWQQLETRLPRDAKELRQCLDDLGTERQDVQVRWDV